MLHYQGKLASNTGMEVSVLERQHARLTWLQQLSCGNLNNPTQYFALPEFNHNLMFQDMKEQFGGNDVACFGNVMAHVSSSGLRGDAEGATVVKEDKGEDVALAKKIEGVVCRDNLKKRKAEFMIGEECTEKCIKTDSEEAESKVTEKSSRETSVDTSKGNSKLPEVKKPDYIHVRARRGQATDSHSLAERARREKISKKMKCLQDLVPGCNKAMGKAGMLDEIINYVHSLQRQVEFLSMKLAAFNPRVDFNIDGFLAKEFPACLPNFQAATGSTPIANSSFNQLFKLNPGQHGDTSCNLDMSMLTNSTQEASQRIPSSSMPCPELYLNPTSLPHVQPFSVLDADLLRLYNAGYH